MDNTETKSNEKQRVSTYIYYPWKREGGRTVGSGRVPLLGTTLGVNDTQATPIGVVIKR